MVWCFFEQILYPVVDLDWGHKKIRSPWMPWARPSYSNFQTSLSRTLMSRNCAMSVLSNLFVIQNQRLHILTLMYWGTRHDVIRQITQVTKMVLLKSVIKKLPHVTQALLVRGTLKYLAACFLCLDKFSLS